VRRDSLLEGAVGVVDDEVEVEGLQDAQLHLQQVLHLELVRSVLRAGL
jgi:hypothetical protein